MRADDPHDGDMPDPSGPARRPARVGESLESLTHDLGVHQAELEMQNQELRRTHAALEASRDRYLDLYDHAPVGYVTVSIDTTIVECNHLAESMFDTGDDSGLLQRPLAMLFARDERPRLQQHLAHLLRGDGQQYVELQALTPQGQPPRWLALQMRLQVRDGERPLCRIALIDVSPRVEMQDGMARLAAIVASSEDAIISRDLAGRIGSWNAGAQRLFGRGAEEMLGKTMDEMVPPERRAEEADLLRRLRGGDSVIHMESERLGHGGLAVPISLSLSPIRDGQGAVTGSALIARDISERRSADVALHKRLRQLDTMSFAGQALIMGERDIGRLRRSLFERVRQAIGCELRLDYGFENGDEQRLRLLSSHGLSPALADALESPGPGESLCARVAEERSEIVLEALAGREIAQAQRLVGAGARSYAGFPLIAQGRCFGVAAFASTTRDHFQPGDIQVVRAVCDQVSAMLERARLLDELHASELSLKRADRAKDDFIATLAHELRNPLAPLRNAASILRHGDAADASQLAWCRDVIDRQLTQMTQLLEDLLDVSRLTRNTIELRRERLPLLQAIEQALETAQPLLDERGHRITLDLPDEPVYVQGDLTRLTQVFANLLDNASKYTDPGGAIKVTVRLHDDHACISVRDSGIGIEPQLLPKVFDMFAQLAPARSRSGGGLGIGLALSRGLVQLHGGSIEAFSEGIGRGSEFVVRLPIAQMPRPLQPQASPPAARAEVVARRVAVADDNVDAAQTLAMVLALDGHEARTVYGGRDALALIAQWQPEVAVVDIGMKDLDGYQLCRAVRARQDIEQPLMIACTGWGQDDDIRRSRESGFDFHLVKPIEPEALLRLIAGRANGTGGAGMAIAPPLSE